MALSVSLGDPALTVDPGGFVRTDVRIRNTGTTDVGARVAVTGPGAPWSWVVPPQVDVPAGGETVVSLGFRVQRAADPAAGALAFEVEVRAAGAEPATEGVAAEPPEGTAQGTLTVAPYHHVSVDLDPPGSGPTGTDHYIVVENRGNVPATTTLRPGTGGGAVVAIGAEVVETPPGARVVVPVTVHPGRGSLLQPRSTTFAVSAEPTGEEPVPLAGTVVQPPRVGPRASAAAVVVGVLLLGLALRLTVFASDDSSVAVAAGSTATSDPGPAQVADDVDPRCPARGHTDPMPIGTVGDVESLPTAFSFFAVAEGGCQPVRWNPCQPIHYVVNPANAPPTGVSDVKEAFRRLAIATGMTYVDDGVTDETDGGRARAYQPARYGERWAPILVHWRPPRTQAPAGSQTVGGGAPVRVGNAYVSGELQLSATFFTDERTRTTIGGGFVDPITIGRIGSDGVKWGRVMLHELGHITGLGHTSETDQLMYPDAAEHTGTTAFQAGDLAGLKYLGMEAGCTETPPPAPVAGASRFPARPSTTTSAP